VSRLRLTRVDARYSTRAGRERRQTCKNSTENKDETSRDIGIASLPLRACRPSGGSVVGTLSVPITAVKRFWRIRFPPNVDESVDTMCIVPGCFVDQCDDRIAARQDLCGNLLATGLIYFAWLYISTLNS
jgi:hypothetical protein